MASVKFYVHKKKSGKDILQKELPIQISFTYDSKRVITSSGETCLERNWDLKKQRVKGSANGAFEINNYLDFLSENLMKYYRETRILGEKLSRSHLMNIIRNKPEEEQETRIIQVLDQFMEVNRATYAINTIKKFVTLKNHLLTYQKKYRITLDFDAINNLFYDQFKGYFLGNGMTNNSIATNFRRLKWFLNWATERGLNANLQYKKFKVKETHGDIIILTWDELLHLYNMSIEDVRLAKVRDAFCFASFSGLRWSDLHALTKSQIVDDSIRIRVQKTRDNLIVPLNDYSRSILKKYKDLQGDKALPVYSNQKMNQHLKELGKLAGFDTPVTRYRYRGSQRIEETKPKHQFVTCHMARRNFISHAFKRGVPAELVMRLSNHKSHRVMALYNNISLEDSRAAMVKAFSIKK